MVCGQRSNEENVIAGVPHGVICREDDYEFCRRYIKDENKVISQTIPSRAEYIFDNEELAAVLKLPA